MGVVTAVMIDQWWAVKRAVHNLWGWEMYFQELSDFITPLDGDRISFANERFTDYVVDRLSTCVSTLSRLNLSPTVEFEFHWIRWRRCGSSRVLPTAITPVIIHYSTPFAMNHGKDTLTIYKKVSCVSGWNNLGICLFNYQALELSIDLADLNLM